MTEREKGIEEGGWLAIRYLVGNGQIGAAKDLMYVFNFSEERCREMQEEMRNDDNELEGDMEMMIRTRFSGSKEDPDIPDIGYHEIGETFHAKINGNDVILKVVEELDCGGCALRGSNCEMSCCTPYEREDNMNVGYMVTRKGHGEE